MPRTTSNLDPALARFWHPVASLDDLADGPHGVQLMGRHYVLVELGGEVVAFADECPHRGVPLSTGAVVDGVLRCAYHGYCFDREGTCVSIPALDGSVPIPERASLAGPWGVTIRYGLVWIAPEEPIDEIPDVVEWDDAAFGHVLCGPWTIRTGAAQITENFLDVSHFPFVHAGTFGKEEDALVPDYTVERDGLRFRYGYSHLAQNPDEVVEMHGAEAPEQIRVMDYTFFPPFGVIARIRYEDTGVCSTVFSVSTPVDRDTTVSMTVLFGNDFTDDAAELARAYEEKIVLEDVWILESYREPVMVLDLPTQFHTAADRMTVEYRRVMAEILDAGP